MDYSALQIIIKYHCGESPRETPYKNQIIGLIKKNFIRTCPQSIAMVRNLRHSSRSAARTQVREPLSTSLTTREKPIRLTASSYLRPARAEPQLRCARLETTYFGYRRSSLIRLPETSTRRPRSPLGHIACATSEDPSLTVDYTQLFIQRRPRPQPVA